MAWRNKNIMVICPFLLNLKKEAILNIFFYGWFRQIPFLLSNANIESQVFATYFFHYFFKIFRIGMFEFPAVDNIPAYNCQILPCPVHFPVISSIRPVL